jgi:hypothetical protein
VAFTVGDAKALVHELQNLWSDPVRMRRMALAAFDAYRERHSEQAAYAALMSVYAAAMAERRTR